MLGFERFGEFRQAVRASRAAAAADLGSYSLIQYEIETAEGMFFGLLLMLPFWISMAYAIELLTR